MRVTSLSKPLFGATFTVQMETAWSLTKVADRTVVLRKAVQSSGTATMGERLLCRHALAPGGRGDRSTYKLLQSIGVRQ